MCPGRSLPAHNRPRKRLSSSSKVCYILFFLFCSPLWDGRKKERRVTGKGYGSQAPHAGHEVEAFWVCFTLAMVYPVFAAFQLRPARKGLLGRDEKGVISVFAFVCFFVVCVLLFFVGVSYCNKFVCGLYAVCVLFHGALRPSVTLLHMGLHFPVDYTSPWFLHSKNSFEVTSPRCTFHSSHTHTLTHAHGSARTRIFHVPFFLQQEFETAKRRKRLFKYLGLGGWQAPCCICRSS